MRLMTVILDDFYILDIQLKIIYNKLEKIFKKSQSKNGECMLLLYTKVTLKFSVKRPLNQLMIGTNNFFIFFRLDLFLSRIERERLD